VAVVVLEKEEAGDADFRGRIAGNEIRGWETGRRKFETRMSRKGECRKSMHWAWKLLEACRRWAGGLLSFIEITVRMSDGKLFSFGSEHWDDWLGMLTEIDDTQGFRSVIASGAIPTKCGSLRVGRGSV